MIIHRKLISNNGKILTATIEFNEPSEKGLKQFAQALIQVTNENSIEELKTGT